MFCENLWCCNRPMVRTTTTNITKLEICSIYICNFPCRAIVRNVSENIGFRGKGQERTTHSSSTSSWFLLFLFFPLRFGRMRSCLFVFFFPSCVLVFVFRSSCVPRHEYIFLPPNHNRPRATLLFLRILHPIIDILQNVFHKSFHYTCLVDDIGAIHPIQRFFG